VAVIDLGFAGLSDAIAAGVLPHPSSRSTVQGECTPTNFSLEEEPTERPCRNRPRDGPAAQLYLIKGVIASTEERQGLLHANGIRVINHSVVGSHQFLRRDLLV